MVDQSIHNRIAEGGIPDAFVPVLDGHLTGEQRGATARAILDHLEEIASFAIPNRREPPVVELCGASHNSTNGKCLVMWSHHR